MIVRTIAVPIVHLMDAAAEKGNIRTVEMWHIIAVCLQGVRIAIPAAALLAIQHKLCNHFRIYASMVNRWYGYRWWYGRSCRLRNGYQHDGYKRSMAILRNWFLSGCYFQT